MQIYQPPITPEHHTCVGLGLTLLNKLSALDHRFPGLASRVYLASCEEAVDDVVKYVKDYPDPSSSEKEHVMVALKLEVAGRKGILLLDPGYHVARVITVMEDELYPHTGWFTQSKEVHCKKYYNYSLSVNHEYVIWHTRERRGDAPELLSHSAVYVAQPFLSPVDVTERRNLVYNFRSLLSRDTKGHLTAGIYFSLSNTAPGKFSIFYEANDVKIRDKMDFSKFKSLTHIEDEKWMIIEECNKLLGFQPGVLLSILQTLNNILSDSDFISQLLSINKNINEISENN